LANAIRAELQGEEEKEFPTRAREAMILNLSIEQAAMGKQALYKYFSYNQYSLELLINQRLWYAKPASFNDPFDGDFEVSDELDVDEVLTVLLQIKTSDEKYLSSRSVLADENGDLKEAEKKKYFEKAKEFCKVYKNVGVLCLTTKRDNVLMWSHYADHHRGFNLKFDIRPGVSPIAIRYEQSLTPRRLREIFVDTSNGFVPIEYSKHEDWKYEDEWRLAVSGGDRTGPLPGRISEVNFGLRMPGEQRETVFKLLSKMDPTVKFFAATRVLKQIRLGFEEYEPEA
jgi:hypothetical protein